MKLFNIHPFVRSKEGVSIKYFYRFLWLPTVFFCLSCNKEIESVLLPPFDVYPNPFVSSMGVYINGSVLPLANADVRVVNGKDKTVVELKNAAVNNSIQFNLVDEPPGIYYVELKIAGGTFIEPVLKVKN